MADCRDAAAAGATTGFGCGGATMTGVFTGAEFSGWETGIEVPQFGQNRTSLSSGSLVPQFGQNMGHSPSIKVFSKIIISLLDIIIVSLSCEMGRSI